MSSISRFRSDSDFYNARRAAEYIVGIVFAVFIALVTFRVSLKIPLLLCILGMILLVALLCFLNVTIGFYLFISIGFLVADAERYFLGQYTFSSAVLAIPYFLICVILFKEIRRKDFSWLPRHPLIYFYFLDTAYLLIEVFNPQMDSLLGWLSAFWQKMTFLFLVFIACYIFRDLKRIRTFFKFFLIVIFITALYGCIQQWYGLTSFDQRWINDNPAIAALYSLPGEGLRKFSFLTDPANFGTLMASSALAMIALLVLAPYKRKNKVLLGSLILVVLLAMSYSGTRTANLMLAAGLVIFILMTIYQKRTKIMGIAVGLIFLFVLYAPIYGNVTLNRFRSAFTSSPTGDASYDIRLIHRRMMQPYLHKHPFGGGVNTAGVPGRKYNPHHFLAGFPPDGAYFAVALDTGWVGLALNCAFFFLILFYCVHYFYKCRNPEIKAYYAAMTVFLFSSFVGADAQFTVGSVPQILIFIPMLSVIVKLHTFDVPQISSAKP